MYKTSSSAISHKNHSEFHDNEHMVLLCYLQLFKEITKYAATATVCKDMMHQTEVACIESF